MISKAPNKKQLSTAYLNGIDMERINGKEHNVEVIRYED
jgi:hypothetical protein